MTSAREMVKFLSPLLLEGEIRNSPIDTKLSHVAVMAVCCSFDAFLST